jgi:hypothetical protein
MLVRDRPAKSGKQLATALKRAHEGTIRALGVTGRYHLHEEGFTRGDANRKEILNDADNLKIKYENTLEALKGVLNLMDRTFLLLLDEELKRKTSPVGARR